MRGSDGNICLSEEVGAECWKGHMETIINEDNECGQMMETDTVLVPIEIMMPEEIV